MKKSNISRHQWQDVLNLKVNKDIIIIIIIKEADNGGSVVMTNTKHYLKMISNHLNDEVMLKLSRGSQKLLRNTKIIFKKRKQKILQVSHETQVISMVLL